MEVKTEINELSKEINQIRNENAQIGNLYKEIIKEQRQENKRYLKAIVGLSALLLFTNIFWLIYNIIH